MDDYFHWYYLLSDRVDTISMMDYIIPSMLKYFFLLIFLSLAVSCTSSPDSALNGEPIRIGVLLPFSGEQAAVGINMEQAVSLAVADVNAAGGIQGRPLRILSRDSNDGSDKGYAQAHALLYDEKVLYLIGPEENALGKKLVPDIKALDILNILPGFAAPVIQETGAKGGWLHLAPSPAEIGCAMAKQAVKEGNKTVSGMIAADDYQTQLASEFLTFFSEFGGRSLGIVTVDPQDNSYIDKIQALADLNADITLLNAYPTTASVIIQEWAVMGYEINWYLSSTLHTEMFLQNIPVGVLNMDTVFSPSISLKSECTIPDTDTSDAGAPDAGAPDAGAPDTEAPDTDLSAILECRQDNVALFSEHYAAYWGKDNPLPASLFYYDAIMLTALGLALSVQQNNRSPSPTELRAYIRQIAEAPGDVIQWNEIDKGLQLISENRDIAYSGAAAEYIFDGDEEKAGYGLARQRIIDVWRIKDNGYVFSNAIEVTCSRLTN